MTGLAEGSMTARMKMTSQTRERRAARRLLATGLFLIAMTAGSYWIADGRAGPSAATAGLVLGIAALKAHLVAGVYMEMLQAPRAWAVVMSVFLVFQALMLIALYS